MKYLPIGLPILFVVCFPIFWVAVSFLIALMGGWLALARSYGVEKLPDGESLSGQSAKIGLFGNYNNCLVFVLTDAGLGMRTYWLFKWGHEPLFIPWDQITVAPAKFLGLFDFGQSRLDIASHPHLSLTLGQTLSQAVRAKLAQRLQV